MHLKFFAASKLFAAPLWKTGTGAYVVSACLGNQQINLVDPIIVYTSLFITGGLTSAGKRRLDLHHRNTEDQLFPHNSLSANMFSTLTPGPSCCTQNPTS
jgi:hypothetical protein